MMRKLSALLAAELVLLSIAPPSAHAFDWGVREENYRDVIAKVETMPMDGDLQTRAGRHGLNVVNVMWEDTGRYQGSSVGPNISDLTLQVRNGQQTHLLPVIRFPNYDDKTADVPADKIWVRVGNQRAGGELVARPLSEVLSNLKEYLTKQESLKGTGNFMSKRDSHFLVSAQHVFLPIPKQGKAEFNPVLYNYQSMPESPAVMTLLVTREGTSATIIENRAGDQSYQGWGQQLFFNNAGKKTAFTAERRSDVAARIARQGETKAGDKGALEEGADMMMIVQVPLVHRNAERFAGYGGDAPAAAEMAPMDDAPMKSAATRGGRSDVERAVLGHGEDLGTFVEMGGLQLVRDERFPIRVTVQFYKATSNGVVSDQDLAEVARTIGKVYSSGDYVGSLVVPESEHVRPTSWQKNRVDRVVRWFR